MNRSAALPTLVLSIVVASPQLMAETVRGSVTGPEKRPIAGATVLVFSAAVRTPFKVKSGADGTWTVDLPKAKEVEAVPAAYADILAALVIAPGQGFGAKYGKKGEKFDIVLPPSTDIGGTATDEKGIPLPNVEVRLKGFYSSALNPENPSQEMKIPFDLMSMGNPDAPAPDPITAKTDAAGKWHFDGVPQGMRVFVGLADDRFSVADTELKAGTLDATIKASIGAIIKGRVLQPDGKPAVGVQVISNSDQRPKTDAQGRFTFKRLGPGDMWISIYDAKKVWMPTNKNVSGIKAGETRDIGDITISKGVMLSGKVVDDAGKPVEKATVTVNGETVETDALGHFKIRVGSDSAWLTAGKKGYLNTASNGDKSQFQMQVKAPKADSVIPVIKLQRGVYVSGVARDTAGKPAAGAQLNAGQSWENPANATVGKDGTFQFGPLLPGANVTLHVADAWDFTKEVSIKAPALGQEASTKLNLTLKKIKLAPVKGRIITPDGSPVEGVTARFRIYYSSKKDSYQTVSATSDSKGNFTFGNLRPEQSPKFDSLASDKYSFVKSPVPVREGDQWDSGDVVVSPLDGKISGQVVDAAGTPQANAKLVVAGRYPWKPVVADAEGRFTLENLPRGEVDILVAKDHLFLHQTVKVRSEARLVLEDRPLPTTEDGRKLLLAEPLGFGFLVQASVVPPLDPDFALQIVTKDKAGHVDPAQIAQLVASLATKDPEKASVWGITQWQKLPKGSQSIESGTILAKAVIPYNREFAVNFLKEARGKIGKNDFGADAANQFIALAGLAAALQDPSAGVLLDLGLTAADRSVIGEKRSEVADNWGRSVGTSPEMTNRLIEEMEPLHQVKALAGAVQSMAKVNPEAARKYLVRITALTQTASMKAADAKQETERQTGRDWRETSKEILSHAQSSLAEALATKPGTGALDVAKGISEDYRRCMTLVNVARTYARFGHTTEAEATIRAYAAEPNHWSENAPNGTVLAFSFNKALAAELLEKERARIFDNSSTYDDSYRPSAAGFALGVALTDPGEARLLLENEWSWRVGRLVNQSDSESYNSEWQMRPLALTMGTMDLPRALEMLQGIKDRYNQDYEAKWQIGLYLMTNGQTDLFSTGTNDDF